MAQRGPRGRGRARYQPYARQQEDYEDDYGGNAGGDYFLHDDRGGYQPANDDWDDGTVEIPQWRRGGGGGGGGGRGGFRGGRGGGYGGGYGGGGGGGYRRGGGGGYEGGFRGRGRGRGFGGGRGRGRGRGGYANVSKESLDNDLDDYFQKDKDGYKKKLDDDLEGYFGDGQAEGGEGAAAAAPRKKVVSLKKVVGKAAGEGDQ